MALYQSADDEVDSVQAKTILPDLKEKTSLALIKLEPKQHFTQPPPRFSEASLVKELEENGIGRPSTYAAILSTIREKGYVELIKGYFRPSELGFIVTDLLVANFPDILDVDFTAKMEENLDRIETAEIEAIEILKSFYDPFSQAIDVAAEKMLSVKGVGLPTPLSCPQCRKPLNIKVGRNGHFLACSGYPQCDYSRDYQRDERGNIVPVEISTDEVSDKICPKCGRPMIVKQGKFGKFLACGGYPDCTHTQSLNAGANGRDTGVKCPREGCEGSLVERTSKRGKIFFGCSRYPQCNYAIWDKPVVAPCPQCGSPFMVEKSTKKRGTYYACLSDGCGYQQPAP